MSDAFPPPTGRQPWDDPRPHGHDDRPLPAVGSASGPADRRPPLGPGDARPASGPDGGPAAAPAPQAPRSAPTELGDHHPHQGGPHDEGRARAPDEIEETIPAVERLRAAALRLWATTRSSVPVRTALFLLPPLVLPVLALDLSLGAALAVTLLLLWLAAAAGIVATLMFDGSDLLALRAIERRIDELAAAGPAPGPSSSTRDEEALLVVGAQLDALNDRLDALTAGAGTRRSRPDVAVEHRPAEQWSPTPTRDHNDGHDHDVAPGRHWSPSEWQR